MGAGRCRKVKGWAGSRQEGWSRAWEGAGGVEVEPGQPAMVTGAEGGSSSGRGGVAGGVPQGI